MYTHGMNLTRTTTTWCTTTQKRPPAPKLAGMPTTCQREGCTYTTKVEIPALKHKLVHHDAKAPSCTEIGWEEYDTCSRCDYTTKVELLR